MFVGLVKKNEQLTTPYLIGGSMSEVVLRFARELVVVRQRMVAENPALLKSITVFVLDL
jgi:hypothetical protein